MTRKGKGMPRIVSGIVQRLRVQEPDAQEDERTKQCRNDRGDSPARDAHGA